MADDTDILAAELAKLREESESGSTTINESENEECIEEGQPSSGNSWLSNARPRQGARNHRMAQRGTTTAVEGGY